MAGATFVTWDRVVLAAAGGITPYEAMDHALEHPVEGVEVTEEAKTEVTRLRQLSPAQLTVMADGADNTWAFFKDGITVTEMEASWVRRLRVDSDFSWRAIARSCSREWRAPWGANQIAGMAICEKAAKLFQEDFMQPPWN